MSNSNFETAIRHSQHIVANTIRNYSVDNARGIYGSDKVFVIGFNTIHEFNTLGGRSGVEAWNNERDLIIGNHIFDSDTTAIRANENRTAILGNRAYNVRGPGIRMDGPDDCEVRNNYILNASIGVDSAYVSIALFQVTNPTIGGNRCLRDSGEAPKAHLNDKGGCSGTIVKDNYFDDNADKTVIAQTQDLLIRNNEGYGATRTLSSSTPQINWYDEVVLLDASGNNVDATLPNPAAHEGRKILVKAIDTTNTAKFSQNGSETIDGAAEQTLGSQYAAKKSDLLC